MNIFRTTAACILACSLIHPVAAGAVGITVNQGDGILVKDNGIFYNCTVGYVDKDKHRLWTAGHCAHENANVYTSYKQPIGSRKHRYDKNYNPNHSGHLSNQEIQDYFFQDMAYVALNDDIVPGENSFSGDRTYAPHKGEKICRYGAHTNTHIYCGRILSVTDQLIYATDLNTQGGDSGGPTWVPEEGYTGQAVGSFFYQDNGQRLTLTVIHRADLAEIIDQPKDETHYQPASEELSLPFEAIPVDYHADAAPGKALPTAAEFDEYVRNYEIALEKIKELQGGGTVDPNWDPGKQAELNKAKEQLAQAKKDLEEAQRKLEEAQKAGELNQQLEQELEASKQKLAEDNAAHEKFKKESQTGLIISIVAAVLGLLGAIAGWLIPHARIHF